MFNYDRMLITPKDTLAVVDEPQFVGYLYHSPKGSILENEISLTVYKEGATVPYHMHTKGFETFTLETGRAEVTIAGKRCIIEAGDMVQIEPFMPHGFRFLVEGSRWRELFQELDMYNTHSDRAYISVGSVTLLEDDCFMKEFRSTHNNTQLLEPEPLLVDKSDMPMICPKGEGITAFSTEGMKMTLKIGRWQLHGNKEIWEYAIEKGWTLTFGDRNPNESIYLVRQGKMRVEAAGRKFIAEDGDMICIPQYTSFRMQAVADDTILHDYNCKITLFRMLEEIETESAREGSNPDVARAKYFALHNCPLMNYRKMP